jgi:hypothetical protein
MAGTAHGSNQPAIRFFRTEVPDAPEAYSTEMPASTPMLGGLHPGGKDTPLPGRRRAMRAIKDLPWRSWLDKRKPRKKRRNRLGSLMGS